MPVQMFASQNANSQTVTTTTETVILTFPAISTPNAGSQVTIQADMDITWGTGTTTGRFRIRRGTGITGTIVADTGALSYTAGSTYDSSITGEDTPGEVAGQAYVVTVQAAGASGNSTVSLASGSIMVGP